MARKKRLKVVYPVFMDNRSPPGKVKRCAVNVIQRSEENVYDVVDRFTRSILPRIKKSRIGTNSPGDAEKTKLADIVNLHNKQGIRNLDQIDSMYECVKEGQELTSKDDLPNIRIVKVRDRNPILFDGHHSCLAYMLAGRISLNEIPHLLVSGECGKPVENEEIKTFYAPYADELQDPVWRRYVINWEAPEGKKLEDREQNNMEELFNAIFAETDRKRLS